MSEQPPPVEPLAPIYHPRNNLLTDFTCLAIINDADTPPYLAVLIKAVSLRSALQSRFADSSAATPPKKTICSFTVDNDLPAKLKALKTAGIIDQHALDAYAQAIRELSPAQRNAFAKQTQIIRTTQAQLSRRGLRDYLEEPKTNTL